jgi:hypothetical protein
VHSISLTFKAKEIVACASGGQPDAYAPISLARILRSLIPTGKALSTTSTCFETQSFSDHFPCSADCRVFNPDSYAKQMDHVTAATIHPILGFPTLYHHPPPQPRDPLTFVPITSTDTTNRPISAPTPHTRQNREYIMNSEAEHTERENSAPSGGQPEELRSSCLECSLLDGRTLETEVVAGLRDLIVMSPHCLDMPRVGVVRDILCTVHQRSKTIWA